MKKLIIYLSIIVALFAGLYALNYFANGSSDNPYGLRESELTSSTRKQLNDPNYQNIILPDQLKSMLVNKESGFIYFFSPDCPHCVATTPLLNPVAEQYNVDLPKFNLLQFNEGWNTFDIESTPTLVYYQDGVEVERIVGGMELVAGDGGHPKAKFEEFFKKYNVQ
ncbi:MAG: thioredoxin family protein [Paenibacillaceae bacterium]